MALSIIQAKGKSCFEHFSCNFVKNKRRRMHPNRLTSILAKKSADASKRFTLILARETRAEAIFNLPEQCRVDVDQIENEHHHIGYNQYTEY